MATMIKGHTHTSAVQLVGETEVIEVSGKRTITCVWEVDYMSKDAFIATQTSFSGLKRASARSERTRLNICRVTMTFGGLDPAEVGMGQKKTYRQGRANATEPIETHPKFLTYAGYPDPNAKAGVKHRGKANADGSGSTLHGIWKAGDEGAIMSGATFVGWTTETELGKKFQGMHQYKCPTITWTETIVSTTKPGVNMRTGTIDSPPGGAPMVSKFSGARNWLLDSAEQEENGSAWTTTRTWIMSGEQGWLTEWYNAS